MKLDAATALLLAHLPSPDSIRLTAGAIVIILGVACLANLHVPKPRDRGGFR